MTFVPSYYKKFRCIADRCTHSCCVGWDIYIDDVTLKKYETLDRISGCGLLKNVGYTEDGAHFILSCGDRCPNLLENNLCRLICDYGEDILCDICREHPRFRCFFGDREEIGLGLSCEEAARIILSYPETVSFERLDDAEEEAGCVTECIELLVDRDRAIDIIQDRNRNIKERADHLLDSLNVSLPYMSMNNWCDFYLNLERLDDEWTNILQMIKVCELTDVGDAPLLKNELAAEQLMIYFICRHYKCEDGESNITDVVKFALLSTSMIFAAAEVIGDGFKSHLEALCEAARMYSSEIEYSTDNTDEVLFELSF